MCPASRPAGLRRGAGFCPPSPYLAPRTSLLPRPLGRRRGEYELRAAVTAPRHSGCLIRGNRQSARKCQDDITGRNLFFFFFKALKKSLLKSVSLQHDPSCFRFSFAFRLYGNRQANPSPPPNITYFSLPLIYSAVARRGLGWGWRSEFPLRWAPPEGKMRGMPVGCILRPVHPSAGVGRVGILAGSRLARTGKGRRERGNGAASPFPVCLLMFRVGALGSYKEVPKLHSKTAPRYSARFAILLRSIQRSM